jgi:hypothetical protein
VAAATAEGAAAVAAAVVATTAVEAAEAELIPEAVEAAASRSYRLTATWN